MKRRNLRTCFPRAMQPRFCAEIHPADCPAPPRRLAADSLARQRARPRSQNFFGSEPQPAPAKVVGGGMNASLDPSTGSLVWD